MFVPKTTEIDGVTFAVTPLPGMRALEMQPRLARIFAPALAQAGEDVAAALDSFFTRLSPAEYVALTKELLANATADEIPLFGTKGCFDSLFSGRSHLVPKLLRFAIEEVNFAGFFAEFGTMLRKLVAAPSQTTPKAEAPAT